MPNNNLLPPRKKLLCYSDSVTSNTGFGVVSRYILAALHSTGLYEIDQLAINFGADFYDREKYPYCILPAKLKNPSDPYGGQMFVDILAQRNYDLVLVVNDTAVVESVAQKIDEIKSHKLKQTGKCFQLVYYFPVDCRLWPESSTMIKVADRTVAYNKFGADAAEKIGLHATDIIGHGIDPKSFYPLGENFPRTDARKQLLRIDSDETFLWINVNRNSIRKDIARTILAFSEFKKIVPDSMLYLNTSMIDGPSGYMLDLRNAIKDLGLESKKSVVYPTQFNVLTGFPVEVLNQFYNIADGFISTSLGEGWGLSTVEAMAAKLPVVTGNHTANYELMAGGDGYLYPCKEKVYVDNSGFRDIGRLDDIVEEMLRCYKDRGTDIQEGITRRAFDFAQKNTWDKVGRQWIKLFSTLETIKPRIGTRAESI